MRLSDRAKLGAQAVERLEEELETADYILNKIFAQYRLPLELQPVLEKYFGLKVAREKREND